MNRKLRWLGIGVAVAVAGAAGYFFWLAPRERVAPPAEAQAPAGPVAPVPAAPTHYPIETATSVAALPPLDGSDTAIGDALLRLFGRGSLPSFIVGHNLIRRIVATVDNLPRRKAPVRMMPVKPPAGRFVVSGTGADLAIDPANSRRYAAYADILSRIDVPQLVDLYVRFYPLFQQAYLELGYPKGYFNDRLVEALDDLLAAPTVSPPPRLVQTKVLYEFSDPSLEARSAGQKIMIRMGSDNANRTKPALRAIRAEVVRRASGG